MVALRCIGQTDTPLELLPGATAVGFRELGSYFFFAPINGASLYIDEAPAEPATVDGVQGWRWQPGFYAGQVVAELVNGTGQRIAEYFIDVAPDDSKLGVDIFRDMLDELYAFEPALLLGTEAAQVSIGVTGELASPLLAYARLRRYGDAFVAGLKAVATRPLTRLRRERTLLPYQKVRCLDAASARTLLRRPDTAAFVRTGALAGGATPLFDVVQSTDDLDNPVNRVLGATLLAVRRRCLQVAEALQEMAAREEETDTRTPLKPRLPRKLEFLHALAQSLTKVSRLEPYASLRRLEVTAAGLNAVSADPLYARVYRLGWSVLRPGVAGDIRDECLWISPTWEIYERWCFARVATCLREQYSGLAWKMHATSAGSDRVRLVGTAPTIRIEVALQRCFRSQDVAAGDLQSISMQLQPDLVITAGSGDQRRMLVLDAKYRTSRKNVLGAMRSAHIYRDALRWGADRAVCSLLLVPKGGGAPWLEESEFQAAHRVGVHVLAPDSSSTALGALFDRWLA